MPRQENVAGGPEIQDQVVDLSGLCGFGALHRVPEAQPKNTLGQVLRETIRPDIQKLRGEICIFLGSGSEKVQGDGPGDFRLPRERGRRVHQHIVAVFYLALVAGTRGKPAPVTAKRSPHDWHRVCRIVDVRIGGLIRGVACIQGTIPS